MIRPARPLLGAMVLVTCVLRPAFAGAGACEPYPWTEAARAGDIGAIPSSVSVELEGVERIGAVEVIRRPIFDLDDPREDRPLYRLANRLHVLTREAAIVEQLEFTAGDRFDARALADSERLLRTFSWLFDARVVPLRRCGDAVDVAVVTRDVWSLVPTGSFDRSGGETSFAFGLKDVNLLGRGETLGAYYEDGVDRSGFGLFYDDPALAGSEWRLRSTLADNEDGHRLALDLRDPFRSLDDTASHGGWLVLEERIQPLFDTGVRTVEFEQTSREARVFLARSEGRTARGVRRLEVGIRHWDFAFERADTTLQPSVLPRDRSATGPYVAVELLEDEWGAARNLDTMARTEDIYLGRRLHARLGVSPEFAGADDGRVLFTAGIADAGRPWPDGLLSGRVRVDGAVTTSDGEAENVVVEAGGRLFHRQSEDFTAFASLSATWTRGLTRDRQLLLGGDSGLRAYPQRFQDGDRRVLARFEQRWFSGAHPLQLFRFGAAVFVDAGRAWFPGDPDGDGERGWLADAGVGLRLVSDRIPMDSVIHLDLAVPLVTGGRDVEDVQLSLTVRDTF